MKVPGITIAQMFSIHKSIFDIGQGFDKNAYVAASRRILAAACPELSEGWQFLASEGIGVVQKQGGSVYQAQYVANKVLLAPTCGGKQGV